MLLFRKVDAQEVYVAGPKLWANSWSVSYSFYEQSNKTNLAKATIQQKL